MINLSENAIKSNKSFIERVINQSMNRKYVSSFINVPHLYSSELHHYFSIISLTWKCIEIIKVHFYTLIILPPANIYWASSLITSLTLFSLNFIFLIRGYILKSSLASLCMYSLERMSHFRLVRINVTMALLQFRRQLTLNIIWI